MHTIDSREPLKVDVVRRGWLASLLLRQQSTWFGRFTLHFQRLSALRRGGRRRLQRKAAVSLAGAALLLSLGVGAMRPPAVHAATITVDGAICNLVDAITAANTDAIAGGCLAGSGADTIDLQTDVLLAVSNNYSYISDTGLPVVTTDITIEGNGHTIERDGAALEFRLLAVSSTGDLTINNATLSGGSSEYDGGAIYNDGGTVTLNDSTVSDNYADENGGGIHTSGGTVTLNDSTVSGNSADDDGAGINSDGGTVTLDNSTFSGNHAEDYGGGIYDIGGTLTVTHSTISGNFSDDSGGGIYSDQGLVTLTNSTVSGNQAGRGGGGIYVNNGTLFITGSVVSGNSASDGGGLYLDDDSATEAPESTIVNSTISNNSAASNGGAIYLDAGILNLINVTIAGNSAVSEGGALFIYYDRPLITISRSLLSGNAAGAGDEIYNARIASITADNYNIFGDSGKSDADAFYNFAPGASDLNATTDGTPTALAAILDTTLAPNGGPTDTHALVANSPAIDFGPTADCAVAPVGGLDQRGFGRSVDVPATGDDGGPNLCDTGAYEYLAQLPVVGYCPVDDENVGPTMTGVLGVGQGSPTKGFRTRKLVVPNSDEVVGLYGQLAAVDVGVMKYVRFLPQGYPKIQVHAPTSLAYQKYAVSWWGTDLPTDANWVKDQFFWGAKGNKSPRAFVLWPTYQTTEDYANVFETFDESSENHVAWEPGFIPVQTQTLEIPATQADGADITVSLALVDLNKDDRSVIVTVEAGDVSEQRVLTVPNRGLLLNIEEFLLEDVDAGTDEVTISLASPVPGIGFSAGGDSMAMIGAAANYVCEAEPSP